MKKITGDELPDFYNIVLERPKDDPDGYDVLFIDAAAKVRFVCGGVDSGSCGGWGWGAITRSMPRNEEAG